MQISIGERIRQEREKQGLSQRRLGIVLGLSDKAISSYESGRTIPPLDTLLKISNELNKPVSYFLSDHIEEIDIVDHIEILTSKVEELLREIGELRNLLKKN